MVILLDFFWSPYNKLLWLALPRFKVRWGTASHCLLTFRHVYHVAIVIRPCSK
ncbi:hypothetical protein [Vibrio gallaecicus]|uniref:hypothetical protein n=1 Tax=Vibrio gallaecicus TaxID=552386 RepID=UPI0025B4648F|nr:hypothetical protein [Vibrio gallaecicus]MDN3613833.1 hypothetical protein [Vibrio gallaecicus]